MISVIAGVNGAGKSSVLGSLIRSNGADYFNPDEHARRLMVTGEEPDPGIANGKAWQKGFDGLSHAIDNNLQYTFETTLGGNSITGELNRAIALGTPVRVIYVGLDTPERHIERVRARVSRGGHPIAEGKIRQRFEQSRLNLIDLIHHGLDELVLWDNSATDADGKPEPVLVCHLRGREWIKAPEPTCPLWARPIAAAAMEYAEGASKR